MKALHKHIQRQQDRATDLSGILLALDMLKSEGLGESDAQVSLLVIARELIDEICTNLDSVNLPKVPA